MSNLSSQLQVYLKKIELYSRVSTLLDWDLYTQTPALGYEDMADALTFFSTQSFELSTSDELFKLLNAVSAPEEYDQLSEGMKFTVRTMKRDIEKKRRIPAELYEKFVSAQGVSRRAWEKAKEASDFSIFAPHLEQIIELTKELKHYTDPDKDVYEALLDDFEEGMDSATIDRIFGELKEGLIPLVRKILSAPQPVSSIYQYDYDPDAQKKVQDFLLNYIGFRFDAGTTAESEHPFTLGFSRNDVRLTNHYFSDNPISAMFSAIHEGGHAIFQQNADPSLDHTMAADCPYMGIHESQSRFYENILGRNPGFWKPIYSQIQEMLPALQTISLDDFCREINHVQNSLIRTEADEVTYCMHILIRYEIEQAIFHDQISVHELPALWNKKMQDYLQITPPDDASGILQDMHWSDGSFGYFPSYLLGSIYDGMFLQAAEKELGSLDQILADGDILRITKWLNTQIHQYGGLRLPKDVLLQVCGQEASAQPLLDYFTEKYTKIYQL